MDHISLMREERQDRTEGEGERGETAVVTGWAPDNRGE